MAKINDDVSYYEVIITFIYYFNIYNKILKQFFRFHAIDKYTMNNNLKLHFDYKYEDVYNNLE